MKGILLCGRQVILRFAVITFAVLSTDHLSGWAQAPKGDFLCVGINVGSANYPGRPGSRGGGLSITGDVYVARTLSASASLRFNGYQSENATQIWNFGLKTYVYRFVYVHPAAGFVRILAQPLTVKRGSLSLAAGSSLPTAKGRSYLNFETGAEWLPYYRSGTYYLFGRLNVPITRRMYEED
ncbi:MAG: hypothetical protein FJ344_00705 [Sphingomonadales bacterium]|nr:hypothetical protein [Sphingomonadales bacterium]